jgi:hypothetical protein
LIRRTKLLEEQLETKSSLLRCAMTRLTSCEKEKKEAEKTVEKLIGMANNNKVRVTHTWAKKGGPYPLEILGYFIPAPHTPFSHFTPGPPPPFLERAK